MGKLTDSRAWTVRLTQLAPGIWKGTAIDANGDERAKISGTESESPAAYLIDVARKLGATDIIARSNGADALKWAADHAGLACVIRYNHRNRGKRRC